MTIDKHQKLQFFEWSHQNVLKDWIGVGYLTMISSFHNFSVLPTWAENQAAQVAEVPDGGDPQFEFGVTPWPRKLVISRGLHEEFSRSPTYLGFYKDILG